MGATYTRQSTFTDGDIITAAHSNDEFNQLLAAFAASTGHTHDGTTAEGGPITKLLGTAITIGDGTAGTDIAVTFDGESNDGVLTWKEDEDYFEFSDDILVASTEKLQFRDTAIYINSSTDGQLDLVADTEIQIAATTIDINGNADISGNLGIGGNLTVTGTTTFNGGTMTLGDAATDNVVFGADVNSSIIPNTDDTYDLGSSSQEWRDLYVDGTAYIDTLNLNGTAVTSTAAELNILDGVTATATELNILDGVTSTTAELNILDGVTSTASELNILDGVTSTTAELNILDGVTATASELNILDGVTSTTAELNILDGVTSTATELNIVDGDTSATSTTLADADRVVVNDNGTMVQVALTDFETYFESALDTLSNVTTVGALNSGSITSGFGSIDTGSSTITTTGLITGGSLDIDDVVINGTTIGHTDDTDLITLANGVATVAGELSVTTLDIGGTNVTSTAAELNILDGVTATATELNILDGVTSTTAELNILDGVTATATELNILDGVTSTTAELNILDGVTATASELNILDGVTSTTAELNLVDGSTAGTVVASKAVVVDSNKDVSGFRNVSMTGDLTVAGDNITMGTNTAGHLLVGGGSNFAPTAVGDLTEISTVANDDVLLAVDTSGGGLKKIARSTLVSGLATGNEISNVVEDTTPQLGGDLDVNGNDIISVSNGNINLLPNGSGKVIMDGNGSSGGVSVSDGTIDIRTGTGSVAKILFYCESSNAHAQTLQAQPHSAGVTNVLTLPGGGDQEIVGTTDTQTLTNKTLTTPVIAEIDASSDFTLDAGGNIEINADGGTITFKDGGSSLGTITSSGYSGTAAVATTVTVSDSNTNTNFPVVFHDESNALLDDTGALRYNPSTGTLLVPNLSVAGTTTTVDTVTMNAQNAIVFEGATADANETTLTIVDPTADRTINLPNQSGTIPVLAAASNTAITSTPAELNILDGVTATTAELNILDGVTATASELNIMDGVTATTAELNIMDGVTATTAELNILDGVTASATDINLIDGITNGTVIASKAIITDANKDISGGRNITITGELDAATLDISGNADIDGTLEADAITVNGTALNTVIAGVTVTNATNSAHVLVTDNENTNEENLITFVEDATSSTGNVGLEMDGNLTYNPSTGRLTATQLAGTLQTAAQANITSLGTLTSLTVDDITINASTISDSGTMTLDIGGVLQLDSSDGQIRLERDGTEFLRFQESSGDVKIRPFQDGKDIIFEQRDGTEVARVEDNGTFNVVTDKLAINGTAITSTAAELNILDGVTSTTAELNILDGVTATATEINKLDGVTSTTAELNLVDGSSAGTIVNSKAVVYGSSGEVNATTLQIGGTSITSTAAELNILDGVTSTAAELNILDGVTSTTAELNILDGVTSTATELNIMDGNTSASSTTLVDADRVVTNDNGTMKQVALTDVKTYLTSAGFSTDDPTALAIALG